MGDLYGTSIDTTDPSFGALTDDALILRQKAAIALGTEPGALDGFPDYGFIFEAQINKGFSSTDLAMLPLEVRTALEQEPAFARVNVTVASQIASGDGGVTIALQLDLTGAAGDKVGFTVGQ